MWEDQVRSSDLIEIKFGEHWNDGRVDVVERSLFLLPDVFEVELDGSELITGCIAFDLLRDLLEHHVADVFC